MSPAYGPQQGTATADSPQGRSAGWLSHPASFAGATVVLTLAGAGTSLLAPMLLDPAAFGSFVLVSTLFQGIAACDLGLSQLADRTMVQHQGRRDPSVQLFGPEDLLALRWVLTLSMVVVMAPAAGLWVWWAGTLPVLATTSAIIAGAAFMASNGLVAQYRAHDQPEAFIRTALLMQSGMVLPRLAGLVLAGVNGCFVALAVWYLALAARLVRPVPLDRKRMRATLQAALPLFAFNGLWLVTLAANRWVSWAVSANDTEFGLLAFGSSFVLIGTGLITNISQMRYPQILREAGRSLPQAARMMARDMLALGLLVALMIAVALAYADPLIERLFPRFSAALTVSLVVAVSGLPLALVGWTLPLTISLSRHVLFDAMMLFGPALALLVPMMAVGQYWGGIEGQAWALVANASLLALLQILALSKLGLFSRTLSINSMMVLVLLLGLLSAGAGHVRAEPAKPYTAPEAGQLMFEDRFETLSLWDGLKGRWLPHFPDGRRTIVTNREREFYTGPQDGEPLSRFNPFSLADGLVITARPLPRSDRPMAEGLDYASGMLNSDPSLRQTYGYYEIRAKMPRGRGLWPAFWLAPADQSWPPEIDVFEVHGHRLEGYWATIHQTPSPNRFTLGGLKELSKTTQFRIHTPDLSLDFHDYGVEWGPKEIIWTFDGQQVARTPTPAEFHKPMVMIVNLAVGGTWPGLPDAATAFPAALQVQHIRVYQLNTDKGGTQ